MYSGSKPARSRFRYEPPGWPSIGEPVSVTSVSQAASRPASIRAASSSSLRAAAAELGQRPTRADPAHLAGEEQRSRRRGLVSVEGDETVPALAARQPLEQGTSDLGRPVGAQEDVSKQVGSIG